jgi:hypothetical protein
MKTYRLYFVDSAGKITSAEMLNAKSDDEAVNLARALNSDCICELWNRNSFVATIPALPEAIQPRPAL